MDPKVLHFDNCLIWSYVPIAVLFDFIYLKIFFVFSLKCILVMSCINLTGEHISMLRWEFKVFGSCVVWNNSSRCSFIILMLSDFFVTRKNLFSGKHPLYIGCALSPYTFGVWLGCLSQHGLSFMQGKQAVWYELWAICLNSNWLNSGSAFRIRI